MFKVKYKYGNYITTVYGIHQRTRESYNEEYRYAEFLIYNDNKWEWEDADNYEPIEE